MSKLFSCIIILIIMSLYPLHAVYAQNGKAYIYGTVVTDSGEEFTGFIRWGKEELFWHDLFNANKEQSDQYKVNREKKSTGFWSNFDWDLNSIWKNKYSRSTHLFSCLFGDIKTLHILGGNRVDLEMKNGTRLHLNDGSNDIGTTIHLADYELGTIKFRWNKVDEVRFFEAPAGAIPEFGAPLYGAVKTKRNGTITGFIKWDLDERSGEDILDGESNLGSQKIPFENIRAIEKERNGSIVTLKSGRDIFLDDSNDIDSGNRGIRIYNHGVGNMKVTWNQFQHIRFEDAPEPPPAYRDFKIPSGLMVDVSTFDDGDHTGVMVYDMDEMWEIETLDGEDNSIDFQIPFRNIKRIVPKNSSYSMIYLCSGEELLLGNSQDVGSSNDGLLLFKEGIKKPMVIRWNDVSEININK